MNKQHCQVEHAAKVKYEYSYHLVVVVTYRYISSLILRPRSLHVVWVCGNVAWVCG